MDKNIQYHGSTVPEQVHTALHTNILPPVALVIKRRRLNRTSPAGSASSSLLFFSFISLQYPSRSPAGHGQSALLDPSLPSCHTIRAPLFSLQGRLTYQRRRADRTHESENQTKPRQQIEGERAAATAMAWEWDPREAEAGTPAKRPSRRGKSRGEIDTG